MRGYDSESILSLPMRVFAILLIIMLSCPLWAVERRREQQRIDPGYIILPIPVEIPGVGSAIVMLGSLIDVYDTQVDINALYAIGDFDFKALQLAQLRLPNTSLFFKLSASDYLASLDSYDRGLDSDLKKSFNGVISGGALALSGEYLFPQYHLKTFFELKQTRYNTLKWVDTDQQGHETIYELEGRWAWKSQKTSTRVTWDNTDDTEDPREGVRLDTELRTRDWKDKLQSDLAIQDWNATGYVPFFKSDTLVFNFFRSDAVILRKASTDYAEIQASVALRCEGGSDQQQTRCLEIQDQLVRERIAYNRYGNARNLGGPERLRAYPYSRFSGAHTGLLGVEYRMNFFDQSQPVNYWLISGVQTSVQVAFFHELGTAADDLSEWFQMTKSSTGVGVRLVLSGYILRVDIATGDEGSQVQMFVDYPWNIYSNID